jgi:YD repeat-containing protein
VGPGLWDGKFASPYPTTHLFDALGRETSKTVTRNPALFKGQGDPTLTTSYAYSIDGASAAGFMPVVAVPLVGITTSISLPKAAAVGGTPLAMSRTYDRAGKLMSTTQHLNAGQADVTSQYFYDPAGDVVQIVDARGNTIYSTYDGLGRKVRVQDPDRGPSIFSWDGLGVGNILSKSDFGGPYAYGDASRTVNNAGPHAVLTVNAPVTSAVPWQYRIDGEPSFDLMSARGGDTEGDGIVEVVAAVGGLVYLGKHTDWETSGPLEGPVQPPEVLPGKVETLPDPKPEEQPKPQADGAGAMSRGPGGVEQKPSTAQKPGVPSNLQDTLDRIDRGEGFPHRNDGSIFRNREGNLPSQPPGYYHEYVHPTSGVWPGRAARHHGSKRRNLLYS